MSNAEKLITYNPENFLYLFVTPEQYKYFPAGSTVLLKMRNQYNKSAEIFSTLGFTNWNDIKKVLQSNLFKKYGITPEQFLVKLAQGKTPVPKYTVSGIGAIEEEYLEEVAIDPETGLPLEVLEEYEAAQRSGKIGGMLENMYLQKTAATPLPIYSAAGLPSTTPKSSLVLTTSKGNTYSNIVDPKTGKTKYWLNMGNGVSVASADPKTGKFKEGLQRFKDCWSEIASCTSIFQDMMNQVSGMLAWVMQLIQLCKNNGAVQNCEWSPSQADCWDEVGETTAQTNWGVIALIGLGLYFISK